MNKRFSTLLATVLVAGSLSAAVNPVGDLIPAGIKNGGNVLLRQVSGGNYAGPLFIADNNGSLSTNFTPGSVANATFEEAMAATWKVTIIPAQSLNGLPTYKFVNKKTGEPLAIVLHTNNNGISTTEPTLDEAGNQEWSWNTKLGLYATTSDSTFFLVNSGNQARLKAVKGEAADAVAALTGGVTAFRLDPTTDGFAAKDLTPAGFNYLVGSAKKVYFKNDKDVKNSTATPANILTGNTWNARSASTAADSLSSTDLFLTNTKKTASGNPYMLMTDTLFYNITNIDAEKLNMLVCDTLGAMPTWEQGSTDKGKFLGTIATSGTKVTRGAGANAKEVALRPSAPAVFTGEYFFAEDSMVLYAKYKAQKPTTDKIITSDEYATICDDADGIGQIALKVLNDNKIVLTPAVADIDDETKATNADYILPLIQVAEIDAVADGRTSVDDGLYYIKNDKGQYLASPIHKNGTAPEWVTVNADEQNVAHMPAFQWVVLKDRTYSTNVKKVSAVTVTNREFEGLSRSVQLMVKPGAKYMYVSGGTDSLSYLKIEDTKILGDTLLGYKNLEAKDMLINRYTFNYLHAYTQDKYLAKAADSTVNVLSEDKEAFTLKAIGNIQDYGYDVTDAVAERIAGLKQLRRQAYQIYLESASGDKYLWADDNTENKYAVSPYLQYANAGFYLKENNDLTDGKCYHALIKVTGDWNDADEIWEFTDPFVSKAGVTDDDLSATLKDQVIGEVRTSAFLVAPYDAPLYRRFNSLALEGNEGDAADTLRFKEKYRGEYLQVEANPNFTVKGIDFLGIYTQNFSEDGKSFIVDTAFVNRFNGNIKPQYLISIDRIDQAFEAGDMCPVCQEIVANGGTRPANCPHDKAGKAPFHMGKYLVNFVDSVDNATTGKTQYAWKGYSRAGFVKAAHMGDSLYILTGQFADVTLATFDTAAIHKAVKDGKYAAKYIKDLQGDAHKNVTWSMRYVDPTSAANEVEADRSFLFESDGYDKDIAPIYGSWLKMQNGCLVLSDYSTSTFDKITKGDDALIFNIEKGAKDDIATDNETIATSEVTVIAGEGQVTIAGAQGKKVVVSNVLGQVIANTVITSDNAVIAAPQGVVVVAVEGEEAVKAIVK
jgi:hypothetical protein